MHVQELARLGARIRLDGERATIEASTAQGRAGDGDRSARLGLARDRRARGRGRDHVNRVYHLDRGFERLEEKLGRCGAAIERLSA